MRPIVFAALLAACNSSPGTPKPPTGTPPSLALGVFTDISPPGLDLVKTFGAPWVELDPTSPYTLYLCVDTQGLWKTTDGGTSWRRIGNLDSPVAVRVDPRDGNHLLATQGVRGMTQGFFISHDGGETFTIPPAFETTSPTHDITSLAVDPTDFDHVLLGSHSPWPGLQNAGILESKDGGKTFIVHQPRTEFNSGTMGVNFLYDPVHHQGDANTWLIGTDSNGLWRTTDAGGTWTRITPELGSDGKPAWPDFSITHGGQQLYYASDGTAYTGLFVYPARSTDNGLTWTMINTLDYASYYSIIGDGKNLYTSASFTGDNGGHGMLPYYTSKETDGLTWTKFDPNGTGPQTFTDGPYRQVFDATNRIIYSANWRVGLIALKVGP